MTDEDLIETFLNKRERSEKTVSYYQNLLINFSRYLNNKNKDLYNFEVTDVQGYYRQKETNDEWISGNSIATFLTVLKSFCDFLMKDTNRRIIGKNGAERDKIDLERVRLSDVMDMRPPKRLQKMRSDIPVFLPDIKKIFKLMLQDRRDKDHYNFMRMWCIDWFGCRVSELVEITPDMLNLDNNSIYFNTKKTLLQRMSYYDDFTKEILEIYVDDNTLINITTGGMWKCFNKYTEQFGQRLNTRLGRQSFNTNMDALKDDPRLNKYLKRKYGVTLDDRFVKVMSGHTIKGLGDITMIYKYFPEQMKKDVMINYHYLKPLEKELKKMMY